MNKSTSILFLIFLLWVLSFTVIKVDAAEYAQVNPSGIVTRVVVADSTTISYVPGGPYYLTPSKVGIGWNYDAATGIFYVVRGVYILGSSSPVISSRISLGVGVASNIPVVYQWSFNGQNILGATNQSYTIQNPTVSNTGVYFCTISSVMGTIITPSITITVP